MIIDADPAPVNGSVSVITVDDMLVIADPLPVPPPPKPPAIGTGTGGLNPVDIASILEIPNIH